MAAAYGVARLQRLKTVGFGAGTLLMAFPLPFTSMAVFMKAVVLGITSLETFPAIVSIQEVALGALVMPCEMGISSSRVEVG